MRSLALAMPVALLGLTFGSGAEARTPLPDLLEPAAGRCGTEDHELRARRFGFTAVDDPSDCSSTSTNPLPEYDAGPVYEIQVVVHVLMDDSCGQGALSDELIRSQIEVLNEDFGALPDSLGGGGTDVGLRFVLASVDPDGQPTDGITRSCDTNWYRDRGSYWDDLAWDPSRYMNIYTNDTFALGYVPFLPADGGGALVGRPSDRIVINWRSMGRDSLGGPPYDQGRTATHEIGHFLGLEHTFTGGCSDDTAPGCYRSGDLICDTNPEASPVYSPCAAGTQVSCGSVDPSDNYMDYSDDLCMERFSVEQARRIRCSLQAYRSDLITIVDDAPYQLGSPVPGQAGEQNTFSIDGASAGLTTWLVYGTASGTSAVPGCPGVSVDIANARILASGESAPGGELELSRFAPAAASGNEYRFQAVERDSCTVSDVVTYLFP